MESRGKKVSGKSARESRKEEGEEGKQGKKEGCKLEPSTDSTSDNEVFVSVKSINISGSDSDLPRRLLADDGFCSQKRHSGDVSDKESGDDPFSFPVIKSETRVVVPRVCSDSHIGEGEGFHSSRLSSAASHGSDLNPALLAIGITSAGGTTDGGKGAGLVGNVKKDNRESGEEPLPGNEKENVKPEELGESLETPGTGSCKAVGKTLLSGGEARDVKTESEEPDIDLDTDLSIQVEHDLSVGNTEDFLDEDLGEYDEPDDELHRELEKIFEAELSVAAGCKRSSNNNGQSGGNKARRKSSSPSKGSRRSKSKRSRFVESSTWTQEDDMPSPPSDLSPVESPVKKGKSKGRGGGISEEGIACSIAGHHQGGQFDHQYQYQQGQNSYYRELGGNRRHHHHHQQNPTGSSSRNSRSHQKQQYSSRGIHQSQSHHRSSGGIGEYIHHQPQQHHHQQSSECFTVSSQLYNREARLYENVPPTSQGELETLEILLAGESPGNYPHSGGSGHASHSNKSGSISSNKNNGSSGSGGSGRNSNHQHHQHLHHSANNLNLGPGSRDNSVEQLFSVSELLGPGSCLAVGGGPPSRTSWVDSGRESLSFDGENNNSGGSSRNLLLIPPPPPPPISYQGFSNTGIIMQAMQSPSHQGHSSRKSGSKRDRLVRQLPIDEQTFLPVPTNAMDSQLGGTGGGYLGVPSPRRGVLTSNIIASNFAAAAASPISLQRHPPASQIMLQENKKTKPLMPCESPYGIMTGGNGMGNHHGDWTFGGLDKKSHLARDLLRCRSPQRGRSTKGSKSQNQSFDYGELPSHQMLPKRHLLTSRGLPSHGHQGYPPGGVGNGGNGNANNNNNASSYLLQPQSQHRSFPAGLFSTKSCSMGDLTSSTASPSTQSHRNNYQSFHGNNGKASDQIALCPSTNNPSNALVGSLPLPPQTSVTYEFSLAPQSGTMVPGWTLSAVQRGLALATVPAAVVARRRLPRPRTTRPRFGFTDKNEARKAKWTIAVTALVLLAMSMLLVGITLRLAPLIDDLGSSLSPTKIQPSCPGCSTGSGSDPYARRSSGAASYALRSSWNPSLDIQDQFPITSTPNTPKLDSSERSKVRRSQGDIDVRRQISATLSIPSREDSVKSTSSNSTRSPTIIFPTNTSTCYGFSSPALAFVQSSPLNNNQFGRLGQVTTTASPGSPNCLTPKGSQKANRSRSSSIAQSGTGSHHHPPDQDEIDDGIKTRRQRKYVIAGFSFLVLVAVLCVIVSLGLSSRIEVPPGVGNIDPLLGNTSAADQEVRKENENLMRVIQQTSPTFNMTNSSQTYSPANTSPPPLFDIIEDQDENPVNYNNNNNNIMSGGGQSLTRSVITVDPGPPALIEGDGGRNSSINRSIIISESRMTLPPKTSTTLEEGGEEGDFEESGASKPLSSSLLSEILLKKPRSENKRRKKKGETPQDKLPPSSSSSSTLLLQDDSLFGNSKTSITADTPSIFTEQIISDSDIDENDRVRTSIVLR